LPAIVFYARSNMRSISRCEAWPLSLSRRGPCTGGAARAGYRIHGSNEPWTIGSQVSSGCIRMRNEDVTDLYDRVKVGTKIVVM
jgi:hypothetical protein